MGLTPDGMSKAERVHFARGAAALGAVEAEMRAMAAQEGGLPAAWSEIAREADGIGGRKVRMTVPVDEAVARFFRAAGPGHLARMNRVLRAFMEFRLARAVSGAEWCDVVADPKAAIERWREGRERFMGTRELALGTRQAMERARDALESETARADRAEAAAREMAALMREMIAELEEDEDP